MSVWGDEVKKLEGIIPFNEFWYNSCFMHAVIPVIHFYGNTFDKVFAEEEIIYIDGNIQNSNIDLKLMKIDLLSSMDLTYFLSKYSMKLYYFPRPTNLIDEIIEAINEQIPVIVSIDCFYERQRLDTYQKKHLAHTVLVYGYNRNQQEFFILEHDYENSVIFKEKTISFEELNKGNQSYSKYIKFDAYMKILKTSERGKKKLVSSLEKETDNIIFWDKFGKCIKKYQYQDCDQILEILNKYVVCTNVIKQLKKNQDSINIGKQIQNIRNANVLRSLIAKYKYTHIMQANSQLFCNTLVDEIIRNEKNGHDTKD